MKAPILICIAASALAGCTDAAVSQFSALGEAGEVVCYSGGREIYKGRSTGKIKTEGQSDGYFFRDSSTGKLTRVTGDCIITN